MLDKIIDFHTHPFQSPENNFTFFPELADLDAAGMRRQLEQAGITHICGSVLWKNHVPGDFETVRALNREALALHRLLGDFYTPGFHVHPGYLRESLEEIDFMHRRGVRLMGELVPYLHGWGDFREENWMAILDAAQERGMICSYHTPFDADVDNMAASHPSLIFVAAHPGDRDRVEEHIRLMKKHENLYLDLSGTGLFRFGLLKHLIREVGADRILFGTDYPICNPRMYVQAVYGEDISEEDQEKILFRNVEALLKLQ